VEKVDKFLAQARSDFKIFELLWELDAAAVPSCHALQHFQMSTEKLSKAILMYLGSETNDAKVGDEICPACGRVIGHRLENSHIAFRNVTHVLKRGDVARRLGYSENPGYFKRFLESKKTWFRDVEQLCPSIGTEDSGGGSNGPNVEYPWQGRDTDLTDTWLVPADYRFTISRNLRSRDGIDFIAMVRKLLERVPEAIR
jgi:hypothetical protein